MATRSSDIDEQKPGTNIQKEGHTLTPPSGQNGPKIPEVFMSTLSWPPSQSPVRKPDCPETWYYLEIQVISTKDGRAAPPCSHTWQAPIVEDMVWDGKAGLTEAVVTGPGQAILFYGWQSLGEGLSLGKAWDTAFMLSGAISWVSKPAQLSAKLASLGDGQWLIAQAITEGHIKPRGLSHLHSIPPALPPFNFYNQDLSPQPAKMPVVSEWWEVPRLSPCPAHQEWGWDQEQRQWELWVVPPQSPFLLSDHEYESDRSSASTSSSVASVSERSGGSRHPHCVWWPHRETGGHIKINLLVFKDEDAKDAIMYQSWWWDTTVYHHAGCRDCTLLSYVIFSLQGYPGELVRSSGTDITLDDMLTILDKHSNNINALGALNQELFQLRMGEKETVSSWGVCLSRHLQVLAASFPDRLPPDWVAKLRQDHFYGGLPKWFKAMVAYLKATPDEKTYLDYFHAAWEAEKEETMEPSCGHSAGSLAKPKVKIFFPLRKLKGIQPTKTPAVWLAHLRKRPLMMKKALIVRILMAWMAWHRNSWYASLELWMMHSKTRNVIITASSQIISSGIVCWWKWPKKNQI